MNREVFIKKLSIFLIVFTIFVSIVSRVITFDKIGLSGADATQHHYEMKKYYESNTWPVMGSRFEMGPLLDESKPKVPGGFFYLHYLICYKLGGGDIDKARVWNLISMLIPLLIFLLWVFKRFSITIFAIISALTLMNAFYFVTNISFYNPNLTLAMSFLFLPIFAEYTLGNNKIAAVLIFPILAYMAQSHFAVFYGLVPTVIVYMIIRFKNTKKNIKPLLLSVLVAFISYVPYLVYEVQNNFINIRKMLSFSVSEGPRKSLGFPQVHSLFMFPTDEFSVLYTGNTFKKLMSFWIDDNKYMYLGLPLMVISIVVVFSVLIFAIVKYFKTKSFKFENVYNNSAKDNNSILLNEMMLLFLLYFPVTIIVTMLGKGVAGHFRYHFGAFALSFTPMMYFLYYAKLNKKQNILIAFLIFAILNTAAMFTSIITFYKKYEEPYLWKTKRETITDIVKNANGSEFTIVSNNPNFYELGLSYSKKGEWKEVTNMSSGIIYYIQNTGTYTNIVDGSIISSNQFNIVSRVR